MEIDELKAFAENIRQDVFSRADAAEDGAMRAEAFADVMFEYLREAEEIEDGISCAFEGRGIRCSGYFISEDNERLDLFLVLPKLDGSASSIPRSEIEQAFKRLRAFLVKALDGLHKNLETALDGYDMARSVWDARSELSSARLFVVTDGLAKVPRIENEPIGEIEVSSHLWDLERLHRTVSSGSLREPIKVDFKRLNGSPIRCIAATPAGGGYRCLMAMLPGSLIVGMYREFGPRLLERNVRSFLQLRGKVNQSIRKTILEEPEMFLAFNNGLSITASGLELEDLRDGTVNLISAEDLQIVNGGQTTGSIFRASRKDKVDPVELLVPVKITEILSDGDVEKIAPRISQSANNQNKVNIADFSSNHPFHIRLEELSRSIWAPSPDGLQKQTRWFFERARGQYHDALAQNATPAQRKAWEAIHPRRQMISKTDLAKYENSWSQLPHIVSRYAQKSYLHFMDQLDARGGFIPTEEYFREAIARAIMFKQTERIVSRQKFGGHRAEIVTYTLAWLSHHTAMRVDLEAIWAAQSMPEALSNFIDKVVVYAHEHVTNPPGGQNITEWCKKEKCWEIFRETQIAIPASVVTGLLSREKGNERKKPELLGGKLSMKEEETIAKVASVSGETWFGLSAWAKDTNNLQPWQRSLSFSLGKLATSGKSPSRKQADHGQRILAEARRLGFRG
jgi:AIPR protein/Abortive infection phage resistance protein N-terminal domain